MQITRIDRSGTATVAESRVGVVGRDAGGINLAVPTRDHHVAKRSGDSVRGWAAPYVGRLCSWDECGDDPAKRTPGLDVGAMVCPGGTAAGTLVTEDER